MEAPVYRVWDNERKQYAKQLLAFKFDRNGNVNLVVYLDKRNANGEIYDEDKIYTNDFVVQRYTGLKDKNRKGICEGDIVRHLYTGWISKPEEDQRELKQYLIDISKICVVSWDYDRYTASGRNMYPGKHGFIEVIGNIFENPELLEKIN